MPAQQKPKAVESNPAKPVRLELNNSGAWKVLGTFDAADETTCGLVLDSAETLLKALHGNKPAKRCPTLRVSMDTSGDTTDTVLMRWDIERGWRDPRTGEPC